MHLRFGMAADRDTFSKLENAVELDRATQSPAQPSATQPLAQPPATQHPAQPPASHPLAQPPATQSLFATQGTGCITASVNNILQLHPQWASYLSGQLRAHAEDESSIEPIIGTVDTHDPSSYAPVALKTPAQAITHEDLKVSFELAYRGLTLEEIARVLRPPPCHVVMEATGGAQAGLPRCNAGSLQIVCLSGMLALMTEDQDWDQVPLETYQTCVGTSTGEASGAMQHLVCTEEPCVFRVPALEQHITFICKHGCITVE